MRWQEKIAQAAARRKQELLAEPPQPGMFRPFPDNPFVEGNARAIETWQARRERRKLMPKRPPDRCVHQTVYDKRHPCFHPEGEPDWFVVRYYLPLSPAYLPMRELQPPRYQRRYAKRWCCRQAAEIYAERLRGEGMVDVTVEAG